MSARPQKTLDELMAAVTARFDLTRRGRDTIRPEQVPHGLGSRAQALLDRLRTEAGSPEALQLERTLGEGGMGMVHLATETALGRKVAVKTLRPEVRDPVATERLLSEAMITGSLEHPNVVPVHAVGLDADKNPFIILKRIEGEEWGRLMHDERALRDRFGARDALDWNLRILMQVCEAMQFAHSRGIIHRDLKPENVMIGEFGEVYVLDWGIALALHDDGTGRFPLASDAREVAGTLCYMAPEMLGSDPPALSERTDVYLLGALLFHIVEGNPPHQAEALPEILTQITLSKPSFVSDPPAELKRIVLRAMDPDPDARFENARQLRLAILGFLQHRDSAHVAHEAQVRLADLLAALQHPAADAAVHRQRLYHSFGACRFGFRQALRAWPENQAARDGLHRAVEAMVDFELREGSPEAAVAILAELGDAAPELAARIEKARVARDNERFQMEQLQRHAQALDPRVGRATRRAITVVIGTFWTIIPIIAGALSKRPNFVAMGHGANAGMTFLLLLVCGVPLILRRRAMRSSTLNRRIGATMMFTLSAQLVLEAGTTILRIAPEVSVVLHFFLWFVVSFMLAIAVERRLRVAAVAYLCAFLFTAWRPELRFWMMSCSNLVLTLSLLYAWSARETAKSVATGNP